MALNHRTMNTKYWDGMAKTYEDEVLSVLHSDRQGLIKQRLHILASKKKSVADVGCGIGHFLPLLSGLYDKVYANDISKELLKRAVSVHGHRGNIDFLAGDIAAVFKKIPKVDCIVSVNSLISSCMAVRDRMMSAISKRLKPGGHLILVVPSLESALLVDVRFTQWKKKRGFGAAKALRSVYPLKPAADNLARQGIFPIDGVATKHYLQEELRVLLSDHRMRLKEISKIEYPWDSEFEHPPQWMRVPYPWDWFVIAQR